MDELENLTMVKISYDSNKIFDHLCHITSFLDNLEIKHWIMYGTLLGAYRNKNIIEYDYDFDLGVNVEDYPKILERSNELNEGYKIVKGEGTLYPFPSLKKAVTGFKVSLKVLYDNEAVGDIYLYHQSNDGFMRRFDPDSSTMFWPNSIFPSLFIDDLIKLEIRDKQFNSPNYPEILISHWYGPMWNIPIKANSQDGVGHEDYDYYGSYKYIRLCYLTDWIKEKYNIDLKPNFDKVMKYVFPKDQIEWMESNDPIMK